MRSLCVKNSAFALLTFTVANFASDAWQCPAKADRGSAFKAVDSLTQLRYQDGPFISALGESFQSPIEAQSNAKTELVKKISSKITVTIQKATQHGIVDESSQLIQSAHFDQMALLHSDADLVCTGANAWIAESHLRLQDYSDILKRAYEDSAALFRANAEQALKASDTKAFTSSWVRAKHLQPVVAARGLYLVAILADATRGQSVDISAQLDKTSFPPFFKDMGLWQNVLTEREKRLRSASISLAPQSSAKPFSATVASILSRKGIVLQGASKATYSLALSGEESAFESAYGSVWTCKVRGTAELLTPKGMSVGKVPLRDDAWKDFASADSSAACTKAWAKMSESDELSALLLSLFTSIVPVD